MSKEHSIVGRVQAAKSDMEEADGLISDYMPFIKSEIAKVRKRSYDIDQSDELSIGMIAFHEAINGYNEKRGNFLSYASLLIRNRIIDFWRKNDRHNQTISMQTPSMNDDGSNTLEDTISDGERHDEVTVIREATKEEIVELTTQMASFGVSLTDVAESSPKQERTLEAVQRVARYVKDEKELMENFLETKRLPLAQMTEGTGVSRKTIERHRKYVIALLLIYSNGYEIIRGHLAEVMKEVTAK